MITNNLFCSRHSFTSKCCRSPAKMLKLFTDDLIMETKMVRIFNNPLGLMEALVDETIISLEDDEKGNRVKNLVNEELNTNFLNHHKIFNFLPGPREESQIYYQESRIYFKKFSLEQLAYLTAVESYILDNKFQDMLVLNIIARQNGWYQFDDFNIRTIPFCISGKYYEFILDTCPDYVIPSDLEVVIYDEHIVYVDKYLFIALIFIIVERNSSNFASLPQFIRLLRRVWRFNFYYCKETITEPLRFDNDAMLYYGIMFRTNKQLLESHPYYELIDNLYRDCDVFNQLRLLLSGDVESNPGPVQSTLRANRQIVRTAELQIFGIGNSINHLANTLDKGLHLEIDTNLLTDRLQNKLNTIFPQFVLLLTNLYRCRKDKITCCTVLAQFLLGFQLTLDQITTFFNSVYGLFVKFMDWVALMLGFSRDATNQAGRDDEDECVKGLLSKVISLICPSAKSFLTKCNTIYTVDKGVRGVESLIKKILHYSRQLIDSVLFRCFKTTTNSFSSDILNWNERAVALMSLSDRPNKSNEEIVAELDDLISIGSKYYLILDGCYNRSLCDSFKVQFRQLQSFQLRFSKTASPQKMKIPPYVITLYGASGSGKSQVIPYALLSLMSKDPYYQANPEKLRDFASKIHYRQTENEFWDSLQNQQDYLCIDDFGQVADRMNNSEYAELIRILNTAPAKAHMSNIFEKGLVELDFKAVILTTNLKDLKTENITHPDAIKRRLEGTVWNVTVKDQYVSLTGKEGHQLRRLDPAKVGDDINLDIYLFQKYNVHTLKEYGPILDFTHWIEFIQEDYAKHKESGSKKLSHLSGFVENLISQGTTSDATNQISLNPFEWFRFTGETYPVHVYEILGLLEKNEKELSEYYTRNEATSVTLSLLDKFYQSKKEDRPKLVYEHLASFILILSRVGVESQAFQKASRDHILTADREQVTSLQRIGAIVKIMGEMLISYGLVVGGAVCIITCIKKLFSSIYNCIYQSANKELVVPTFIFDYITINGEMYFRGLDETVVRDKFPEILNWHLLSNYFLIKDAGSLKLKKSISYSHVVYKYSVFILDLIKDKDLSYLESKYGKDLKPKFMHLLETSTKHPKLEVEVRKAVPEKYSTTISQSNKFLLEQHLGTIKERPISDPIPEAHIDQNVEVVMNTVLNNQVFIQLPQGGLMTSKGVGTFYKGKLMVTFLHLLPLIYKQRFGLLPISWTNRMTSFIIQPEEVKVHIPTHLKVKGFSFPLNELDKHSEIFTQEFGCKDIVVLDFSKIDAMPNYPNITKHIVSKHELSKVGGCSGILVTYDKSLNKNMMRIPSIATVDYPFDLIRGAIDYGDIGGATYVRDGYQYNALTKGGDCGSLLFVENNFIQGKVIGMHVSGFEGNGMGNSVSFTKEMLDSIETAILQVSLDLDLNLEKIEYVPSGVLYVGSVDQEINQAGVTQIQRSAVYNKRDITSNKPAYLRPIIIDGIKLDPFKIGIEKYYTNSPFIKSELIETAFCDFSWFMKSASGLPSRPMRVFNLHEAVYGIETEKYWRSIPMGTSPGFSWPKHGFQGKRFYFQNESISEEVVERTNERIRQAKQGIRMQHLYVCTLKDETRPIIKVNAGKTRVFTVPQLDYVLAVRQYFGDFCIHFMKNRIKNKSLVGINMYSVESHQFAKLLKKHRHVLTGDFANWDGSIRADISWKLLQYINDCYAFKQSNLDVLKEDNKVRIVLFWDLINSIVLIGKRAYLLTHSLPSGHPLTTIINTLYNIYRSFLEYLCILMTKIAPDFDTTSHWQDLVIFMNDFPINDCVHKFDIKIYLQNVEGGFYGDDLVLSVSDSFVQFYNYQTIKMANIYIGHKYTTSEKSDIIDRMADNFDEANILKRHFVWNEMHFRYIAPLDISVILDIPNWVKKGHDVRDQTVLNVEVAARELSLHSKHLYDKFISDYTAIFNSMGLFPYFQPFNIMQARVLTGEYMEYLF
nr:non-structural polyprotein [Flumine dicistrovirus 2]